jgi:hypothetical protein
MEERILILCQPGAQGGGIKGGLGARLRGRTILLLETLLLSFPLIMFRIS